MTIASRFHPRPEGILRLTLDGEILSAHPGDTLAAALLAQSGRASRVTANSAPRTAYCMMGLCFDCLIEIDGQPNVQACMTQARDGMVLRRMQGLRGLIGGTDV